MNTTTRIALALSLLTLTTACDPGEPTSTDTHDDAPCDDQPTGGKDDLCPAGTAHGYLGAFCDEEPCPMGMACVVSVFGGFTVCAVPCDENDQCAHAEEFLCPGADIERVGCRAAVDSPVLWCFANN